MNPTYPKKKKRYIQKKEKGNLIPLFYSNYILITIKKLSQRDICTITTHSLNADCVISGYASIEWQSLGLTLE